MSSEFESPSKTAAPVSIDIDESLVTNSATTNAAATEADTASDGFDSYGLSAPVLKSLKKMGYTKATEVQQRCLPLLLGEAGESQDLVALARTGTGKTAAFGIPLIEGIDTSQRKTQVLVLCPTRELCTQVATSLGQIGFEKRIRVLSIYGGDSYRRQFDGLAQGPHIVVATPGRLIDLLERGAVDLKSVGTLVLDEADEMISVGFREALNQILESFSDQPHRTWLFSATMSADVKRVQSKFIRDAKTIDARGQEEKPLIRQQFMMTFEEDRFEALKRYLHINDDFYGLIFCQTKAEVSELESSLLAEGFKVDSLHGDKAQREREMVFAGWKKKEIKIVIATDVAARGLDVKGLTHVVNMSIPREDESYVHRIGRTGRAGREGIALSFVWPKRAPLLRQLERKLGVKLEQVPVPESTEVAKAVLGRAIEGLFGKGLEYSEDNTIHTLISELISKKVEEVSGEPVGADVLSTLAALTARVLERQTPGLLNRPYVKPLKADGPGVSQGFGGRGRSGFGPGRGGYGGGSGRPRFGGDRRDERAGGGGDRRGPPRRYNDRPEARFERPDRADAPRFERGERPPRAERFERTDRTDRPERSAGPRPVAGPRFRDGFKAGGAKKPGGVKSRGSDDGGGYAPRRPR